MSRYQLLAYPNTSAAFVTAEGDIGNVGEGAGGRARAGRGAFR